MADSPINIILKAIEDSQELKVKPSSINPNKQINDLFGVADEPLLDFSSQANLTPNEESKVGKLRDKETGMKSKGDTGSKTFKGLSETGKAVTQAKVLGAEAGEVITPSQTSGSTLFNVAEDEVQDIVQKDRPFIEGEKKLKAGEVFPDAKVDKKGKLIEPFDDYFKRVQSIYDEPLKIIALQKEVAKQYAMKYPEYKTISKNLELIERGLFDFDPEAKKVLGLKIPEKGTTGVRKIVTEALENNEGYVTKANSIDKVIGEVLEKNKQESFDKLAVRLIGETDPDTGKPYTAKKINKMIEDRLVFAGAKYKSALDKEITNTVMDNLRGSYSSASLKTLAEKEIAKVAPKKIAAFTTALSGIISSGKASDLLIAGTKATGLAVPFELLLPNKAEAATLYDPEDFKAASDEMDANAVEYKFGTKEPPEGPFALIDQKKEERLNKENYDPYEAAGVERFLPYFFKKMLLGKGAPPSF